MNVEISPQYLVPKNVASTRFCPMEERNSRELRNLSFELVMRRYSAPILRGIVKSAGVGMGVQLSSRAINRAWFPRPMFNLTLKSGSKNNPRSYKTHKQKPGCETHLRAYLPVVGQKLRRPSNWQSFCPPTPLLFLSSLF